MTWLQNVISAVPAYSPCLQGPVELERCPRFPKGSKSASASTPRKRLREGYCAHRIEQACPHQPEGFPQSPVQSSVHSITHKGFLGVSLTQIEQKVSVPWDKSMPSRPSLPCRRNPFFQRHLYPPLTDPHSPLGKHFVLSLAFSPEKTNSAWAVTISRSKAFPSAWKAAAFKSFPFHATMSSEGISTP